MAHLEPYVGRCWPILSQKIRKVAKSGKSTKHRKTRGFLALPCGSAAGAAAPLSYGEERTAFGNATARGPLLVQGSVGRGWCWRVFGWPWIVLESLELVGWSGSGGGGQFGVGGLEVVSGGLCLRVWGWWVGVGRAWCVHESVGWGGWGLVSGVCV